MVKWDKKVSELGTHSDSEGQMGEEGVRIKHAFGQERSNGS